jgi:hypothetical protein
MADVSPRTFPDPSEVDLDQTPASAYMATELPSVDFVHPVLVGADELVMCIHLDEDGEQTTHMVFPKAFLPDPPSDEPIDDEDRKAYTDRCDDLMAAHAERILRAVWT